jgi:hypothetical protein
MKRDATAGAGRIHEVTERYEAWLRQQTTVVENDLDTKHEIMRQSPFPFLRATYYAWAESWPTALPKLFKAPAVIAVGDLHLENFGTWRDGEGRLAWGINDFDEASLLPYTNDLVRLATSAALAFATEKIRAPAPKLCSALLGGYAECLKKGGQPILFAEGNRRIGQRVLREMIQPRSFWKKKLKKAKGVQRKAPRECRDALVQALPKGTNDVRVWPRVAGVGSLGRPRFVAVGEWNGAHVAREAKARVGSATQWTRGAPAAADDSFVHLLKRSIRSRDPFLETSGAWVVRRLAPDIDKVAIRSLGRRLELKLATLMGREIANVHLATKGVARDILRDLDHRQRGWLLEAARVMANTTIESHAAWRRK